MRCAIHEHLGGACATVFHLFQIFLCKTKCQSSRPDCPVLVRFWEAQARHCMLPFDLLPSRPTMDERCGYVK